MLNNIRLISGEEHIVHENIENIYSKRCFAANCFSNNLTKNVRLFKFPGDKELINKWILNLNVDPGKVRTNMYACQLHFCEKYLSTLFLPKGVLPKIQQKGKAQYFLVVKTCILLLDPN